MKLALTVRCVQPQAGNRHGVFFTHAREAVNYHYERDPSDPRVSHALTLEVDEYGNALKSAAVGYGRAAELLMLGDFLDAASAARWGLSNRVVAKDKVAETAQELALKLARGPSFGLEVTKKFMQREAAMDLESALAAEVEIQAACMEDPSFRESYDAWVEKRPPRFL